MLMFVILIGSFVLSACVDNNGEEIDRLNEKSYNFHYKNLDSVSFYANKAFKLSDNYTLGKAEAINNLAFVDIINMRYSAATLKLRNIYDITDNQVELLVTDIQLMRLSQRKSKNKDFYNYLEQAKRRLKRINEESKILNSHQRRRLLYAKSEYNIVTSTYYYYVGLEASSAKALQSIDAEKLLLNDTAQYLNYLYNVGSGGTIRRSEQYEVNQIEFDYLIRCNILATKYGYVYFEANTLQSLSELILLQQNRKNLIRDNRPAFNFLNRDSVPDSLLAGNFAERALDLFSNYGDVYQRSGAYRTLASCFWNIKDYESALYCLQMSMKPPIVQQAPDLIASVHEQMSVVFSAINDKKNSDFHRNAYLDLQDLTRQDRFFEARAGQMDDISRQLNYMISSVVLAILLLVGLLFLFHYLRKRDAKALSLDQMLAPLKKWQEDNKRHLLSIKESREEIEEAIAIEKMQLVRIKEKNLEKRAKLGLVFTITPFIDRMLHEIAKLKQHNENKEIRQGRFDYISELTERIIDYNDVLTHWIQLKQGELSLNIESFPIQYIFDLVEKSRRSFQLKEITLEIIPSNEVVKADKILTLFMLNTLADNARKFTPQGGKVTIDALEHKDYVEVRVQDTGIGIEEEEIKNIFERKSIMDKSHNDSHGFGLVNCIGIINKYKKSSSIFASTELKVESKVGKGSIFSFTLPKGILKLLMVLLSLSAVTETYSQNKMRKELEDSEISILENSKEIKMAGHYADLAYYSNIKGTYEQTLAYADTCRFYLNKHLLRHYPNSELLLTSIAESSKLPIEILWLYENIITDYNIILDIRNEIAVAALALHQWNLYRYNNKAFIHLYKELSSDNSLAEYCQIMKHSETNKNVAVLFLVVLFLGVIPIYYFMYYRHLLFYRLCLEQLKNINDILLSDQTPLEKKDRIALIKTEKFPTEMQEIISIIIKALEEADKELSKESIDTQYAVDLSHKLKYEVGLLHISNNIIDNCLSTLKHETMYYPTRINQLSKIDSNLIAIDELASYYKELYTFFSKHAIREASLITYYPSKVQLKSVLPKEMKISENPNEDTYVIGEEDMLNYLFYLLNKEIGQKEVALEAEEIYSNSYLIKIITDREQINGKDYSELFLPSVQTLPFLICKQIVRELGELSHNHNCGINAEEINSKIVINIILTKTKILTHE